MKNRILHSAAAFVLAAVLTLLCACNSAQPQDTQNQQNTPTAIEDMSATGLTLSYSGTDNLDPYDAVTKYNRELCSLLFDTLIVLDKDFNPVNRLAQDIVFEENTCKITIKPALFTDGSQVTAEDVTYSLKKARNSETKFKDTLSGISDYNAINTKELEIKLDSYDPYFINLLDFPIIKMNSDGKTNEDGKSLPSVGSGRYIYDMGGKILKVNSAYIGEKPAQKTIELVDTPDAEAIKHNIEVGKISMFYSDLSDNTPLGMAGQSIKVPMNNLVFLGINYDNGYLSDPRFRQAVNLAVNRTKIANEAYYSYAEPATGPFPKNWKEATGLQSIPETEDAARAAQLLADAGYSKKDGDGFLLDSADKRISLLLVCNSDNYNRTVAAQFIAAQLAVVGISCEVRDIDSASYFAELGSRSFDLYIGEVKIKNNMDLRPLLTPGSGACFGYIKTPKAEPLEEGETSTEYVTVSAFDELSALYSGEGDITSLLAAFNSELPVIPLVFRCGQMAVSEKISGLTTPSISDLFFGIEKISFK